MNRHTIVAGPLGDLTVTASGDAITGLYFPHHWTRTAHLDLGRRDDAGFAALRIQLAEFFAGERTEFDLPLHLAGSGFASRVWDRLAAVPYGTTTTYGALASEFPGLDGIPAQRIGAAVGRNPVSIIVPCHRVVGAQGALTGYAGGLDRKRRLLDLEAQHAPTAAQLPLAFS